VRSLPIAAIVIALTACARTESANRVDPGLIRVGTERVVRTDTLGDGETRVRATFVLVDAENLSELDLDVTLVGTLTDGSGAEVGPLRAESLRIPARGTRTFVLPDARYQERPGATGAVVEVRSAIVPRWDLPIRITDGHVHDDRGAAEVAATIVNDSDRRHLVLVFAGFHDDDRRPMERQFTLLDLGPGRSKTVRFHGPDGSRSAYLFLGDATVTSPAVRSR
jgi:hypothetical protein